MKALRVLFLLLIGVGIAGCPVEYAAIVVVQHAPVGTASPIPADGTTDFEIHRATTNPIVVKKGTLQEGIHITRGTTSEMPDHFHKLVITSCPPTNTTPFPEISDQFTFMQYPNLQGVIDGIPSGRRDSVRSAIQTYFSGVNLSSNFVIYVAVVVIEIDCTTMTAKVIYK